ncbi:MAG: HAMP domain-containing sensor histidine kinase [Oscillospiraceae bacterium]|nr:HAMP domain-containing sensor histidine kinase [Oscillospiraceae bacterium]
MKTSIRNKLTAMILAVCLSILAIVWVITSLFFKPMYYRMTQNQLTKLISSTAKIISDNNGELTDDVTEKIKTLAANGYCIEIADEFGNGIALFEGIGDGCSLHVPDESMSYIYGVHRRMNNETAVDIREQTRKSGSYVGTLNDAYGNRQPVRGKYWNNRYTIVASTSLASTDSIISIVTAQLKTATIFTILIALIISAIMSHWFVSPIMTLSKATKEVAKGKYDIEISFPEDPTDEFGQLAADFNSMVKEIKTTQDMQKELVSGITHDLRTPLTIIKGYAESIRDITGDNREIRESQLNTIIDETDRLTKMVNSVLEYTKLSQGAYKLNFVQYNIADMCLDIVDIYKNKAEKEGKTIRYEGVDEAYVTADASLIERVLHNFVSNALVHTPQGTEVVVGVNILPNGKVKVSVTDSGEGISEEDQKHIFDRYYRSRKDLGKQGTGLGLAVVKTVMENHHFEYGVTSQEGKGSEFWFIM